MKIPKLRPFESCENGINMHILRDKSVKMQFPKVMLTKLKMLDTARWHEGKK